METWLVDVKQMRIPRPKFVMNGNNSMPIFSHKRPREPPRDYNLNEQKYSTSNICETETEKIRKIFQEKL